MRSPALLRLVPAAAALWFLVLPSSAAAFPVTGPCSLSLTSTDGKGATLDTAKSGDSGATEQDPLLVDWDGTLTWNGTSSVPLQNNHYHVLMFGFPTPFQGGSVNSGDSRASTGTFAFRANSPFRFTGLYYLTAGITGSGGDCEANVVVRLTGDAVGSLPFFVALGLLAIGGLLAVWGLSGHLLAALFGGLIVGTGVALVAIVFGILPLGSTTPIGLIGVGFALGIASALIGRSRLRAAEAAATAGYPAAPTLVSVAPTPEQRAAETAAEPASEPAAEPAAETAAAPASEAMAFPAAHSVAAPSDWDRPIPAQRVDPELAPPSDWDRPSGTEAAQPRASGTDVSEPSAIDAEAPGPRPSETGERPADAP